MSDILNALYRKAIGYTSEEEVREYSAEDELIKRKVTLKNVPPDTAAAKAYLECDPSIKKYSGYSVEKLIEEASEIYKEIEEIKKQDGNKED